MEIRSVHTIFESKFISSCKKYICTIGFTGYKKTDFWLTEKQYSRLIEDMGGNKYGNKKNIVWCVVDGDRYVWSSKNDSGLEYLKSRFDIESHDS